MGVVVLGDGRNFQASRTARATAARMITDLLFIVSSRTSCPVHNEAASRAWQVIGKGLFSLQRNQLLLPRCG